MRAKTPSPEMALAELRRAAVSAFGKARAAQLLRALEQNLVATANAITNARYARHVDALARAVPRDTDDIESWLDDDDLPQDLLRMRVEAVELALGPILGGREDDGTLDADALRVLAEDIELACSESEDADTARE